jgi:short subunit dehydrogenase-like uncharacterized protein
MKAFDLVLFGATGFTGRLVAEYLLQRRAPIKWAIAGRDRRKLEALDTGVPILIADANDLASLDAVAAQTRVVCSTVGPYAKYGSPLVEACAKHGVDYCDLTGETHWIRRMIDAHHEQAKKSGARIVHCCGFDSIPSDLGTFMVEEHARATHGAPCDDVVFAMRGSAGGVSGGTIASMLNLLDEAKKDREVRKVMFDPYALNPEGERNGPDGQDQRTVRFDDTLGAWTAPFVMAAINARIVRRSNALAGYRYGRDFKYREVVAFKRGPVGLAMASGMTAGLGGFMAATAFSPTRKLLERTLLPAPGQGPSQQTRERGYFRAQVVGTGKDKSGRPFRVEGRIAGHGDPGYAATARMLAESALSLASDPRDSSGGVLTPATPQRNRQLQPLRAVANT